jgi:hypothetical protein
MTKRGRPTKSGERYLSGKLAEDQISAVLGSNFTPAVGESVRSVRQDAARFASLARYSPPHVSRSPLPGMAECIKELIYAEEYCR